MGGPTRVTPLMEQYFAIKTAYEHALLFFQVGDFYELFFDDAQRASAVLGIALTKRGTHNDEPVPLCGVPCHALDHHLAKLVKAGFHVAICDQLEEARPGVVVRRGVTRVLTPGTLTDAKLLDAKRASYLCCIVVQQDVLAFVCAELLTGQLLATVVRTDDVRTLEAQLARFVPDEIVAHGHALAYWQAWLRQQGFVVSAAVGPVDDGASAWLENLFGNQRTVLERSSVLRDALAQLYAYLKKNQAVALDSFKTITCYRSDDYLIIDAATQRNLELVRNMQNGSTDHTLFSVLDRAVTSMGSRMLKKWILSPLLHPGAINQRLDGVQALVQDIATTQQLVEYLREVGDLERVVGRIALQRAQVHDYVHVRTALQAVPRIARLMGRYTSSSLLGRIAESMGNFESLCALLQASINDDATKDWLIKPGFDLMLDQLRDVLAHAHDLLVALECSEQERTTINSLKVRYNQVQGYYIEVTKPNLSLVPADYQRMQTLANVERFTTPALAELEHQLNKARTELDFVEQQVFQRVKAEVYAVLPALRQLAYSLAGLDALLGFALTAYDQGYCRPELHDGRDIVIDKGRHPVVAHQLGSAFIANGTALTEAERLWIVTGPNMGGKSTYLRQVALVCIMAHCGSFVPASSAKIALLDRIFTRVGAGDNLAEGKSTFLVEMEETATICTQATAKSLVILDEVGRGTSTHDGLAIAQAVVEYLYQVVQARCLFATHYHELTQLRQHLPHVSNYHAASKQTETGIVFLHRVVPGAAEGSFGLEVAQLAHVPESIVARARVIIQQLQAGGSHAGPPTAPESFNVQPALRYETPTEFHSTQPCEALAKHGGRTGIDKHKQAVLDELGALDTDALSPRQAHEVLCRLKEQL